VTSERLLLAAVRHLHHLHHEVTEENGGIENKRVQTEGVTDGLMSEEQKRNNPDFLQQTPYNHVCVNFNNQYHNSEQHRYGVTL